MFYFAIPPGAFLQAADLVKRTLMGGKVCPLCASRGSMTGVLARLRVSCSRVHARARP
jgi:NAD(P)H-dependent FMN reductase